MASHFATATIGTLTKRQADEYLQLRKVRTMSKKSRQKQRRAKVRLVQDRYETAASVSQACLLQGIASFLEAMGVNVKLPSDPMNAQGPVKSSLPSDLNGSDAEKVFDEGYGLIMKDRPSKALSKLRKAVTLAKANWGPEAPVVAWYQNLVAYALIELGRHAEAEVVCREALAIREKTLSADDPSIAVSLNNLGVVLDKQGRPSEGVPFLQRALEIESRVFGPNSRHAMKTRVNMVDTLDRASRRREAIAELKKVLAGLKGIVPELHGLGGLVETVREQAERLGVH